MKKKEEGGGEKKMEQKETKTETPLLLEEHHEAEEKGKEELVTGSLCALCNNYIRSNHTTKTLFCPNNFETLCKNPFDFHSDCFEKATGYTNKPGGKISSENVVIVNGLVATFPCKCGAILKIRTVLPPLPPKPSMFLFRCCATQPKVQPDFELMVVQQN